MENEQWVNARLRVVNLEGVVSNSKKLAKIKKTGPHLIQRENSLRHLKEIGVDAVTLANNHILDYGVSGLGETISACEKYGIRPFGYVLDGQSHDSIHVELSGLSVRIYNASEQEFNYSNRFKSGAVVLDPAGVLKNRYLMHHNEREAELCVALLHGGSMQSRLPHSIMRKNSRIFSECGLAVVWHGSHKESCIDTTFPSIDWGVGNFLFFRGKGQGIEFGDGRLCKVKVDKSNKLVCERVKHWADCPEKHAEIYEVSQIINDDDLYQRAWSDFCRSKAGRVKNRILVPFGPFRGGG